MTPPIADEIGQTARSVVGVMKESPLSLALVVVNFALVGFLFYSNNAVLTQRQEALRSIVDWQRATDTLMANCVSMEVTKMTLDNMQRITETMLNAEQKEVQRLQNVIREEREFNRTLIPGFRPNSPPPLTPRPSIPPPPPPAPDPAVEGPR
jgi:hypothetical protein